MSTLGVRRKVALFSMSGASTDCNAERMGNDEEVEKEKEEGGSTCGCSSAERFEEGAPLVLVDMAQVLFTELH